MCVCVCVFDQGPEGPLGIRGARGLQVSVKHHIVVVVIGVTVKVRVAIVVVVVDSIVHCSALIAAHLITQHSTPKEKYCFPGLNLCNLCVGCKLSPRPL